MNSKLRFEGPVTNIIFTYFQENCLYMEDSQLNVSSVFTRFCVTLQIGPNASVNWFTVFFILTLGHFVLSNDLGNVIKWHLAQIHASACFNKRKATSENVHSFLEECTDHEMAPGVELVFSV